MKKINIIKKTAEFDQIIKKKNNYSNRFFIVYIDDKKEKYHRFGISVPKKVGNSVVRNKIKRQIKNIIDQNKNYNMELDYVIIVKKEIINLNYNEMSQNLDSLLIKIDGECKSEKK